MPVDRHENLHAALMGVFDSQIAGGKRYDLATAGRRRAHATYFEDRTAPISAQCADLGHGSHAAAQRRRPEFELVKNYISRFEDEVADRILRFAPKRLSWSLLQGVLSVPASSWLTTQCPVGPHVAIASAGLPGTHAKQGGRTSPQTKFSMPK